jgi:hypothetical protein
MNPARNKLIAILQEAKSLVSLPDNDFSWSGWADAQAADSELNGLIAVIESGNLPERSDVAVLFLPTGPLQEVSLSSGWGQAFLDLAKRFDAAAGRVFEQ